VPVLQFVVLDPLEVLLLLLRRQESPVDRYRVRVRVYFLEPHQQLLRVPPISQGLVYRVPETGHFCLSQTLFINLYLSRIFLQVILLK